MFHEHNSKLSNYRFLEQQLKKRINFVLSTFHMNFCQFNSAKGQNLSKGTRATLEEWLWPSAISPATKVYLTFIPLQFQSERKEQCLRIFPLSYGQCTRENRLLKQCHSKHAGCPQNHQTSMKQKRCCSVDTDFNQRLTYCLYWFSSLSLSTFMYHNNMVQSLLILPCYIPHDKFGVIKHVKYLSQVTLHNRVGLRWDRLKLHIEHLSWNKVITEGGRDSYEE